ncbi:MAG: pyridoxal-phosphate dependent enzyme, partial [Betaproteobacteria bacterium]|nr:pyridoxal-phosphate dependent enzyme [Betaproteobacteria bacterium]
MHRRPLNARTSRECRLLPSVVDAIGDTPLVDLSRLVEGCDGRILAKLEFLNPGFSKKDRIARQIIDDAEADGTLAPGQTVVELT